MKIGQNIKTVSYTLKPNYKFNTFFIVATPLGQLPYLEHNGKQYPQSLAIARYAAKLAKLDGKDALENLEIDGVIDALNDFRISIMFY